MRRVLVALFLLASTAHAQPIPGTGSGGGVSSEVEVTSSALPTGAATEATLSSLNGKVTAVNTGAVVISSGTLTCDAGTGPFPVSDNGGSLTVDGTVAATQSGAWNVTNISGTVSLPTGASTAANQTTANTALAAIQTAVQTLDNAISGSEMQVDVVSSALPTLAATSSLQTAGNAYLAAIETAVELIDNAVSGNELQVDVLTMPTTAVTQSGTWTVQPGNTANTTPWLVTTRPGTTGGNSIVRSLDLNTTDVAIKASAGQLYGYYLYNGAATTLFVKLYNATTATVVVGTTTPVITIPIPAGSAANVHFATGIAFSTAITAACTTGIADANTGAPGANECVGNFFYN